MKKAYFKKECKKLFIETCAKALQMTTECEISTEEDALYCLEAFKSIISQKSTCGELYDVCVSNVPEYKEFISKEDFTELVQAKCKEMFGNVG